MTFAYTKPRQALGDIETPMHLSYFLHRILKHLRPKVVLDPCCGRGNLLIPWLNRRSNSPRQCFGIDKFGIPGKKDAILDGFQYDDFLNPKTGTFPQPELVLCNPPWNRPENDLGAKPCRNMPERFLRRIVELYGTKVPIAFLCPMGFRLNQRVVSKRWRWLASSDAPKITSIVSLPIDCFPKTQFHSEVILFNCRGVKPHYFLSYLPPKEVDR